VSLLPSFAGLLVDLEWELDGAEAAGGDVPDGEVEVVLAFGEVDLLLEVDDAVGGGAELDGVEGDGELLGGAGDGEAILIEGEGGGAEDDVGLAVDGVEEEVLDGRGEMDGVGDLVFFGGLGCVVLRRGGGDGRELGLGEDAGAEDDGLVVRGEGGGLAVGAEQGAGTVGGGFGVAAVVEVAVAVAEGVGGACDLDFDLVPLVVQAGVLGGVGEGVEAGVGGEELGGELGEAVGVVEGVAAGGFGDVVHEGVLVELMEGWVDREAAGVDGVEGDAAGFEGVVEGLEVEAGGEGGGVGGEEEAGAAGEPEDVFAAWELGEVGDDLLEGLVVVGILRGGIAEVGDGFVDGGEEARVVVGEVLEEEGVLAGAGVDGDGLAGREGGEELFELLVEVHLVDDVEGGGVEEEDVGGGGGVEEIVVGEGVGRGGGELEGGRWGLGEVLFEGGELLGLVVVEDAEDGAVEAVDGVAVGVDDGDVGEDDAGAGVEGVGGGGWRGWGLGGELRGDEDEWEERGEEAQHRITCLGRLTD